MEKNVEPADSLATLVLKVGYRGAGFAGYAEQPGERTVAGELRHALQVLLRREVELTCAGRTDAGVHALGQFVSLPLEPRDLAREGRRLERSLSALTPDDLSIKGVFLARPGFSARFDATGRSYRYRIAAGNARPVLSWDHAWWCRSALDASAMDAAAQVLVGEHDFKSFCKASSSALLEADGRSTSRYLESVRVSEVVEADEELVAVDVRGNAFLHNMVRIMVGSLVEVGRGYRDAGWLERALLARDRSAAGPTAPPEGLTFRGATYGKGELVPWAGMGTAVVEGLLAHGQES